MKTLHWCLILAISFLAGCTGKTTTSEGDTQEQKTDSKVITLSGLIDNTFQIEMNLTIRGEKVEGSYYYASQTQAGALTLRGNHETDGHLILNEENADGLPTGHFDGKLNRKQYSGTFVNYKGKSFPFKLMVTNVEVLSEAASSEEPDVTDDNEDFEMTEMEEFPVIKEIEALVLHFNVEEKYRAGLGVILEYKNVYKVTIHMNGDVDIHMEFPTINNRLTMPEVGESQIYDYQGNWAQRSQKRGTRFVDYYDIEFNNGERNLNWCVDNECKSLYFTWDAFQKKNAELEAKILQVDTLYVE